MSSKKPFARIAITLPQEVLAAADRLAERLDRSRSWVIAEAVRQFAARESTEGTPARMVREPVWSPYATSLAQSARRRHLQSEELLSPEERLHRAEELLQLAPPRRSAALKQVIGFGSWDDFARWKASRRIRL